MTVKTKIIGAQQEGACAGPNGKQEAEDKNMPGTKARVTRMILSSPPRGA